MGLAKLLFIFLVDLKRKKLFVKELVRAIEQSVIDTLTKFGVLAERKLGAPGNLYCKAKSKQPLPGRQDCSTWFKNYQAMQLSWLSSQCSDGYETF